MQTLRHELVIVADDFGLSESVSTAIVELINDGFVSVTSAMMCEPLSRNLIYTHRETLKNRCGVHLQSTKARPIMAPDSIKSLVDENGFFLTHQEPNRYVASEIEREWLAQLDVLIQCDIGISHIDSHHNIHLKGDKAFNFVQELSASLGARVRQPAYKRYIGTDSHNCDLCIKGWTLSGQGIEFLMNEIETITQNSDTSLKIEIITHPGKVDERLAAVSSMTSIREFEFYELKKMDHYLDTSKFFIRCGLGSS